MFDGPLGKPPAPEIGQSVFPFLTVKAPVEKSGSFPVSLVNPAPDTGGGLVPAVLRQLHSRPLGKEFHRVYVIQILNFPDKGNNVSSGAAAKAVKIALLRVHMEGRGLFPHERGTIRTWSCPSASGSHSLRPRLKYCFYPSVPVKLSGRRMSALLSSISFLRI